mgnify:CR=1 FL=1
MNFQKLNLEFNNMQIIITKYNKLLLDINNKIKENLKEINKYESKIKNNKNSVEVRCLKFIIVSLKSETEFLQKIVGKENEIDGKK